MNGMTTQERLDDICAISGLSEDIVRRVQSAERDSIVKSLKRGERATLIGRAVLRPEIKKKLEVGGTFESYIKVNATVASSLEAMLSETTGFECDTEPEDYGIRLNQIPSLT